jgi:acetoacetate decarboxylase
LLSEEKVPHTAPVLAPAYPAPPWRLPGATVVKVMYETDAAPVLECLPPKLTRSSPPYAIVTAEHYPDSPVGEFSVATQFIGCRAGFFIRAFALQSVVDGPQAIAALREVWGVPAVAGKVSIRELKDGAAATVKVGGGEVSRFEVRHAEPVDASLIRFDPVLCLRLVPSLQEGVSHDLIQLLQLDPQFEVRESRRGKGSVTYPGTSGRSSWSALPCRNVISAVWCRLDTELPLARFVLPY